jgi:hypothetical protein
MFLIYQERQDANNEPVLAAVQAESLEQEQEDAVDAAEDIIHHGTDRSDQ